MREVIDLLKANNEIRIINEPLDVELEIPHLAYLEVKKSILNKNDENYGGGSKALLFTRPIDKARNISYEMPVLCNLFGSFSRVNLLLGDIQKNQNHIARLLKIRPPQGFSEAISLLKDLASLRFMKPKIVKKARAQEIIKLGVEVDLYSLPVLKTWEKDGSGSFFVDSMKSDSIESKSANSAQNLSDSIESKSAEFLAQNPQGRFITMGQCYTTSIDGKVRNLGLYRLQVYSKNELGLHWQIHKDAREIYEEYQRANRPMPVSIAIGGDAIYSWAATAPAPKGVFELALYGLLKKRRAELVKCISNDLLIPADADIVIEGFVAPQMRTEGRFGDHTGFYTPCEKYPFMQVSTITHKQNPIFLATVVGKPPLEDKFLGYPTERLFLPALATTTPSLIDYFMPEAGVFHNLILAKLHSRFPKAAHQAMHAFWGVGQMSFCKHAIFVGENAPKLDSKEIVPFVLNHLNADSFLFSSGVCDALDHASPKSAEGGKLGIDCILDSIESKKDSIESISDSIPSTADFTPQKENEILNLVREICPEANELWRVFKNTKSPILLCGVNKKSSIIKAFDKAKNENQKALQNIAQYGKILIFMDSEKNDFENLYMILWRVCNNIDALRDCRIWRSFENSKNNLAKDSIESKNKTAQDWLFVIDASDKNAKCDEYFREWPAECDCSKSVLDSLEKRGLLKLLGIKNPQSFYRQFHIDKSYKSS